MIQFGLTSRVVERFGILVALTRCHSYALWFHRIADHRDHWDVHPTLFPSAKGETILRYTVTDSTMQLMPSSTNLGAGPSKALIDGVLKSSAIG